MFVEIIDIGIGNVYSIKNLLEKLNIHTRIITNPNDIKSDFLILPGVGSAKPYMEKLQSTKFDIAIRTHVKEGKKLLGICLGFQILGKYSEEDGKVEGLDLLKGYTKRIKNNLSNNGWHPFSLKRLTLKEQNFQPLLKLTKKQSIQGRVFYNHEYGFISTSNEAFSESISEQYKEYSAIVIHNNIIGMQFHPEKSQQMGIDLMSIIM
jgi:glutamine amidotransferase